ncbi:MAG: heavy-metal-associated domain-containing protein [Anaerolineae bacterium]|nr:heavy-metal-associated domain-containing protein [Anaerolineae bacterium]
MNDNIQAKDTLASALEEATTVYLSVWNMDCPECARFLHEGLSQMHGVVLLEVFYRQGVAVVTYDPGLIGVRDIVEAVALIGKNRCHYYGAEIIGQSPARQALRL